MPKNLSVYLIVSGLLLVYLSRYGLEGLWRLYGLGIGIGGLGLLVFIHELGHFVAGRLSGMAIASFQVGFGPPIFCRRIGETDWKLCLIPLGGAVNFIEEESEVLDRSFDEPGRERLAEPDRWFSNRPWRHQVLTVAAGPAVSILFAVPLLSLCYGLPLLAKQQREMPAVFSPPS